MFLGTKIAKGDEHEDDYYMYNQKRGAYRLDMPLFRKVNTFNC